MSAKTPTRGIHIGSLSSYSTHVDETLSGADETLQQIADRVGSLTLDGLAGALATCNDHSKQYGELVNIDVAEFLAARKARLANSEGPENVDCVLVTSTGRTYLISKNRKLPIPTNTSWFPSSVMRRDQPAAATVASTELEKKGISLSGEKIKQVVDWMHTLQKETAPQRSDEAFGIWADRKEDGLEIERKLRKEWA